MSIPSLPNSVKKVFLTACVLTWTTAVFSQKALQEANRLYEKLAYADAIPRFEKIIQSDTSLLDAKVKLADCYRLTGNYLQAEKWYASIVRNNRASNLERFHYGQMLMNNGNYEEAKRWLKIAALERPHDERAGNYINSIDYLHRFFADSANYKLTNLPVNDKGNDFSPMFFEKGIVYTSSRQKVPASKRHSWTGESYTGLFYFDSLSTAAVQAKVFAKDIQGNLNNGPVSFSQANEMYNTVNIMKIANSKKDIYKLNIVYSKYDGQKWSKPKQFVHNNPAYNIAHPSISADGSVIYFSSDMPGGEGGMDLYYCTKNGESWSAPVNLGKDINTPGNEVFPFIHGDGSFYFSSNGHEGLGGLDVYVTRKTAEGWEPAADLGFPVNTKHDDFGFILSDNRKSGYFSSNRPGGKGGDDIYKFSFRPNILNGVLLDEDTRQPIANATIGFLDKTTGKSLSAITSSSGRFTFPLSACKAYGIQIAHNDYPQPSERLFESACGKSNTDILELFVTQPKLRVEVIDKYSGTPITETVLTLKDAQTNAILLTAPQEKFNPSIKPCTEYIILSAKTGLPEVSSTFKSSCEPKSETVKISMGLPPADPTLIAGTIFEQGTQRTLDSALVVAYDDTNKAIASISATPDGAFAITGFKNVQRLAFFRQGYFSVMKIMADQSNRKTVVVEMPRLALDKIIQLEGIFYDLGKFNIRADAARVLDNVVKVMLENATLKIELSAHTDSRGNDQSNLTLSDKRAKAAAAYIVSKGVAESRVVGKGYGESQLKNNCGNNIKCAESAHQENRRTEVKITGY